MRSRAWIAAATVCVVAASGCFSEPADFPSGAILCQRTTRACPAGTSCGSDGRCWTIGQSPPDAALPPDARTGCDEGVLRCGGASGREQQRCSGNVFSTIATCSNACLAGYCVECQPTSLRCNGQRPQRCGESGSWFDLAACPAATPQCEEGACVPPCMPSGARRCSRDGLAVEECDPTGQFRTVAACMNVCVFGPPVDCGGECRPGAQRCGADQTPEACSAGGAWVGGAPCAGVCQAGACGGECRPGATRCSGTAAIQTCGADATWGAITGCAFVCDATAGKCGGECKPGATRCNLDRAERCDDAGRWVVDAECAAGQCTDGQCKPCTDGTTQCNALMPQRCVGGTWANLQRDACPFLCDPTLGCVGECVPGTSTCSGAVKRTCGADAGYVDEVCPYVCLSGQCAGVCEPGTQRCNATTAQTCNSTGEWAGSQSCAHGCDVTTGECAACTPEPLETTCAGGGCGEKSNNCGDTVTCPECSGVGQTCGGGGLPGFCGCTADPASTTCAGRCAATSNNCGQTVDCPDACVAPQSCGGGGVVGACGCTPIAREVACTGKDCGTVSDGCGGQTSCWPEGQTTCPGTGQTCGGGGTPNLCGCTPSPQCGTRECGSVPDGCGAMVPCGPLGGACPQGQQCDSTGRCVAACVPKTQCDPGFVCGTQDPGCGFPPLNCGTCTDPLRCNEATHQCCKVACTGGAVCGTQSDLCGGTLACGVCPDDQICDAGACRCMTQTELCGNHVCGTYFPPTIHCPAVSCGTCPVERYCSLDRTQCLCRDTIEACSGKECPSDYKWGTCGPYDCGTCVKPETCGGGGTPNVCGCTPVGDACKDAVPPRECGPWKDTCGNPIDCGSCGDFAACCDGKCSLTACPVPI